MSPGNAISSRVLQHLVDHGLLTAEQLASVVDAAATSGVAVGVVLAERGLVDAQDIADVLEGEMGVPHVDLASYAPEARALTLVPEYLARQCRVLPLFEIEGMLTVAVSDPMDVFALDRVAASVGLEVEPVLSDAAALAAALDDYYNEETTATVGDDEGWPAPEPAPEGGAFEGETAPGAAEAAGTSSLPTVSVDAPWAAVGADTSDVPDDEEEPISLGDRESWGVLDEEESGFAEEARFATEGEAGESTEEEPAASTGDEPEVALDEETALPAADEAQERGEMELTPLLEDEGEPTPLVEDEVWGSEDAELAPPKEEANTPPPVPIEGEPPAAFPASSDTAEPHPAIGTAIPGVPSIDLDVLAVADTRNVALLVSDILEDAVARDASRIHLLPYKDDFFLVYRLETGLERIAAAPLSMQAALVEGFKIYAKLGGVEVSRPAFGRVRAHIRDRDLILTVSVVPTVAGQRLVVSLAPFKPAPRDLAGLGASEAESRALRAMVERGRGLLLVCAPVAGGSSTTYYALLAHAAASGKTVYSVERSVEYEIPAVAQVMVQPGGPTPAAYIAAGMRQDTDVIAVDGLRGVEDVHLAVEAASHGKLVIVTFPAADIVFGVHRMLAMGTEPHSLAAALTLGVGQRLVRLNCRNCAQETDGALAAQIPGAPRNIIDVAGSGCPNCGKTGFRGVVGLFEVLPFTEPVRAAIARCASEEEIARAVADAGMRPLVVSGLARVRAGDVSAEELNRVLRFAE